MHGKGTSNRQTHRHTDTQTSQLLDQLGPERAELVKSKRQEARIFGNPPQLFIMKVPQPKSV